MYINYTTFLNNSAYSGDAGALYLDCEDTVAMPCIYNIENTIMKDNTAMINGGAIKYSFYKPITSSNVTFTGNKAQYGNNMASYPV